MMTAKLCEESLTKYIPTTLDGVGNIQELVDSARTFEGQLHSFGWSQDHTLHEWTSRVGEIWGKGRKVEVLHQTRRIIRGGVLPNASLTASAGAVEYENTGSNSAGGAGDWSWDDDWTTPSTAMSTSSSSQPRRKQRHAMMSGQRTYECTGIAGQLRMLLATLLQEYTQLSNYPIIHAAANVYPSMFNLMFSLYRASGVLHAPTSIESPVRLVNDCFFLAGEIGLMALGLGHMGYTDVYSALQEISSTMDLCGVNWRDRYLVRFYHSRSNCRKIFGLD